MAFNYLDMVLPTGVSPTNLVALYQFDGPTLGFTDRSGNGHDLIGRGDAAAAIRFTREQQGAGLWQNRVDQWRDTGNKAGVFNTLGALTVEWVGKLDIFPTNGNSWWHDVWFLAGSIPGGSSGDNTTVAIWLLKETNPKGLYVYHEYGANDRAAVQFDWGIPYGGLHHGVLTRAADGVTYKYYSDGILLQTKVASTPPTGGTGSVKLSLLGSRQSQWQYDVMNATMSSVRYFRDVEFTAEQVAESYRRIHVV